MTEYVDNSSLILFFHFCFHVELTFFSCILKVLQSHQYVFANRNFIDVFAVNFFFH